MVSVLFVLTAAAVASPIPKLLPSVRHLEYIGGSQVKVVGSDADLLDKQKLSALKQTHLEFAQVPVEESRKKVVLHGLIGGPELYQLVINDEGMIISSHTNLGIFYGSRTAIQLIRGARESHVVP